MHTRATEESRRGGLSRGLALVVLALIVLAGLGLRLYRIEDQSVWYDEYISVSHVDDPDLATAIRLQRGPNWNLVPVYYSLQYWWGNYITDDIAGIRMLSILFGMAAIPLMYLLGARLFGRTGGLVAALLLALSPTHIYQAQELRNYPVSMFFAALSGYTFWRLAHAPRPRWWLANTAANILLCWTHLFGVFLLVPEGLFLLLFRRRQFRHLVFPWFVVNLLLMVPLWLWVETLDINPPHTGAPVPWMIVNNLFLDTYIATWAPGVLENVPWANAPPDWIHALESVYAWVDHFHAALLFTLAGVLAWWGLARRKRLAPPHAAHHYQTPEAVVFVCLWLFVPVLGLYAATRVWRPDIFSPKYTNWASLGAFLIAGGAVAMLPRRWLRVGMVGLLIAVYAYRCAFAVTYPQRTDWYSATDYIRAHAEPGDALVITSWLKELVLRYNIEPCPWPIEAADSFVELCEESEQRLAEGQPVWQVVVGYFDAVADFHRLERYWELRGLPHSASAYLGMQNILLLRVAPGQNYAPAPSPDTAAALEAALAEKDDLCLRLWLARLHELAGRADAAVAQYNRIAAAEPEDEEVRAMLLAGLERVGYREEAIGYFQESVDYADSHAVLRLAKLCARAQRHEEAVSILRRGIEATPDAPLLYLELGHAYEALGEADRAMAAFQRAIDMHPGRPWGYMSIAALLERQGKMEASLQYFRKALKNDHAGIGNSEMVLAWALQRRGQLDEAIALYEEAARKNPAHAETRYRLGTAREAQGQDQEAAQAYRDAIHADPNYAPAYSALNALVKNSGQRVATWRRIAEAHPDAARANYHLGEALEDAGHTSDALRHLERAAELDPEDPAVLTRLGAALVRAGRYADAIASLRGALLRNPAIAKARQLLVRALVETGQYDSAWHEVEECAERGVPLHRVLVERLVKESGRGRAVLEAATTAEDEARDVR